jgi:hypothetical protein
MSATEAPHAATLWGCVLRVAYMRLLAKGPQVQDCDRRSVRRPTESESPVVISITYLRRAQIATAKLPAGQLALIAHQAAGGRPREFQQRTGWSAARYRAEIARAQSALRSALALDTAPAPVPCARRPQGERPAR